MSDPQYMMKIPKGMADDIKQLLDRGMSSPDVVDVLVKQTGLGRDAATAIVRAVLMSQTADMSPENRFKTDDDSFSAIISKSPLDLVFDEPAYRPNRKYSSFLFNRGCAAMIVGLPLSFIGVALLASLLGSENAAQGSTTAITQGFFAVGMLVAGVALFVRGALGRI